MSFQNRHFINFSDFSKQDVLFLFDKVSNERATGLEPRYKKKNASLLFFEPSTRTQMSFDLALRDCGIQPIIFNPETSSLKKGETILDTLLNLEAMGFDLFVIRHGYPNENLKDLAREIKTPIINAGEGMSSHPTQALLDCYTILQEKNNLEGERVLFVGDIKHSRVVQSNIELMKRLGIQVAFAAPKNFLPDQKNPDIKIFEDLKDGMEWASVIMALRTQFERHEKSLEAERESFIKNYSITVDRLKDWKKDGIVLHPGPFNRDIEIQSEILADARVCIFKQVENGRKVRRNLIDSILEGSL